MAEVMIKTKEWVQMVRFVIGKHFTSFVDMEIKKKTPSAPPMVTSDWEHSHIRTGEGEIFSMIGRKI